MRLPLRLLPLASFLLAVHAPAQTALPAGWKIRSPKGAGFSVAMPTTPTYGKGPIGRNNQKGVLHRYVSQSPKEGLSVVVGYAEVPPNLAKQAVGEKLRQLLQAVNADVVRSLKGRVTATRWLTFQGVQRLSQDLAIAHDLEGRVEAVFFGRRLYTLLTVMPKGKLSSPSVKAFFSSLRLHRL